MRTAFNTNAASKELLQVAVPASLPQVPKHEFPMGTELIHHDGRMISVAMSAENNIVAVAEPHDSHWQYYRLHFIPPSAQDSRGYFATQDLQTGKVSAPRANEFFRRHYDRLRNVSSTELQAMGIHFAGDFSKLTTGQPSGVQQGGEFGAELEAAWLPPKK